jgi:hypothetical protein
MPKRAGGILAAAPKGLSKFGEWKQAHRQ